MVLAFVSCDNRDEINLHRPEQPMDLVVSKGDTSVFLNWNAVDKASSYVVVRGLKLIAEDINTPSYVDNFAPDTPVEYRVYAVNKEGWRSINYATGSGYVAIPDGILPRPPAITAADATSFKGCEIKWEAGRFATSYNLYRGDVLIAENLTETSYFDSEATLDASEYRIYSVNRNGKSLNYASDTGSKAYFFIDTYENDPVGFEIPAWTFRVNPSKGYGIAYYTEGLPTVTGSEGFGSSSKSLKIVAGKAQLLCDWGGVPEKGKYKIKLVVKKQSGGFWIIPSFSGAQHVSATGSWTTFEIVTSVIDKGATFNLKVEPYGDGAALIDNWSIEYLGVN